MRHLKSVIDVPIRTCMMFRLMKFSIFEELLYGASLFMGSSSLFAQNQSAKKWVVVKEHAQKAFPKTVPPGNYSGITHLRGDVYAVVSDKSDSALYFNFRIQVNPKTGALEHVENLGYTERVDGSRHDGSAWTAKEKGFDHEAIAKVSDTTLVVASEGKCTLRKYPIFPMESLGRTVAASQSPTVTSNDGNFWVDKWNPADFYPNYVVESLAFDSMHQLLWTIPETVLRRDGAPATPTHQVANKMRLMAYVFPQGFPKKSYAYLMDKPSTDKKAETYVLGVSELCVLPDGQLLVLEREAFIPKIKLGAFCKCKLYIVNPLSSETFPEHDSFGDKTPFLEKQLLTEWKTGLSLFDRSFANYEGMCLGPQLEDGSQVVILLSDSQDQYAGVLKDWFKTIVIRK